MVPIKSFRTSKRSLDLPNVDRLFFQDQQTNIACNWEEEIYAQYECPPGYVLVTANTGWETKLILVNVWFISNEMTHKERICFWTLWENSTINHNMETGFADLSNREVESIEVTGPMQLTMKFRRKRGYFKIEVFDPPQKFLFSTFSMNYDLPELWEERHLQVRRSLWR